MKLLVRRGLLKFGSPLRLFIMLALTALRGRTRFMLAGAQQSSPSANSGIMDLASSDFEHSGPYDWWESGYSTGAGLSPPGTSGAPPSPAGNFITLPSHWDGHIVNGMKLGPDGYAFSVSCMAPARETPASVKFGEIKRFALFINGALARQGGVPGTDAARSTPGGRRTSRHWAICPARWISCSRFQLPLLPGGIDRPLLLGLERDIFAARETP